MRYRITVNRALLEKVNAGDDPQHKARPIRVTDTRVGLTKDERDVALIASDSAPRVVYGDPQQDGARVWIEADAVICRG